MTNRESWIVPHVVRRETHPIGLYRTRGNVDDEIRVYVIIHFTMLERCVCSLISLLNYPSSIETWRSFQVLWALGTFYSAESTFIMWMRPHACMASLKRDRYLGIWSILTLVPNYNVSTHIWVQHRDTVSYN